MSGERADALESMWARHHAEWRDTAQIASQWREAAALDPQLLQAEVQGAWWETIARLGVTVLVTREYEHLVMALSVVDGAPQVTYLPLPHPSGMVFDPDAGRLMIASTRNPNQIYDFAPVATLRGRRDVDAAALQGRPLVPVRSRFYAGCLYMHDLALIGGGLYANAVGENAVIRLHDDGSTERVWWPRSIERADGPAFDLNYLQLNSIAAGPTPQTSYYSASTDRISARRPGHRNFAVDGRGVIFDGGSREVLVRGLTRPHSARLHAGQLWVDNSGYGELGIGRDGRFEPLMRLPGWTRGLSFVGDVALVGTSRVIPRFRHYAPGLDAATSVCGLHAVDTVRGEVLGSIIWPYGNQIFAIAQVPLRWSSGFVSTAGRARRPQREKQLFYAFEVE